MAVPAGPRSPDMLGWAGSLWSLFLSSVLLLLKKNPYYAEATSQWCEGIPGSHTPGLVNTPGPVNTALFLQKPFHDDRHLETGKETLMIQEPNAFGDLSG